MPGQPAGGPGGLEVEAAGQGVDVEDFPGEEQAGLQAALHGLEVDFFQADSAAGHKFFFEYPFALNGICPAGEFVGQAVQNRVGEVAPIVIFADASGSGQALPQARWELGGVGFEGVFAGLCTAGVFQFGEQACGSVRWIPVDL